MPSFEGHADSKHPWNPTLASISNSIQERFHMAKQVKQKLRSWNTSISKHGPLASMRRSTPSDSAARKKRTAEELVAARQSVAEQAHAKQEKIQSKLPPGGNTLKRRPRSSYSILRDSSPTGDLRAKFSKSTANLTDKAKRRTSNVRDCITYLKHSASSTNLRKRAVSSDGAEALPREITYVLEFSGASSRSTSSVHPALRQSASSSSPTGNVRTSAKRLRRSASNLSLRQKFARSNPNEQIGIPRPASYQALRTASPAGFMNEAQRSYSMMEFLHPDEEIEVQEPLLLESIAEQSEYQPENRDKTEFRNDLIFATHESRMCQPQAPPIFVKTLPFASVKSSVHRRDAVIRDNGTERSFAGPKRISSLHHQRYSSTSVQMMEQITRGNEMTALRDSINNTRLLQHVAPLEFHQDLCAQAAIRGTIYEIQHGADGSGWGSEIEKPEGSGTLEIIGPPGVGGRVTGKMWADGVAKFSHRDREGRHCNNYTVWEAITDAKWRAIGLCQTEEDGRWVVVLSE